MFDRRKLLKALGFGAIALPGLKVLGSDAPTYYGTKDEAEEYFSNRLEALTVLDAELTTSGVLRFEDTEGKYVSFSFTKGEIRTSYEREFEYMLDRGKLDTVRTSREHRDISVDIFIESVVTNLNMGWNEFIKTSNGLRMVTVDLDETMTEVPYFMWETMEHDLSNGHFSISGRSV